MTTAIAIPLCPLCAHRAHGDNPCGCMDLGDLAAGRHSCGCWPDIMRHPGQREMFVARRCLALGREGYPPMRTIMHRHRVPGPKVTVWEDRPGKGLTRVGTLVNGELVVTVPQRDGRARPSIHVDVTEDTQRTWHEQADAFYALLNPLPPAPPRRSEAGELVLLVLVLAAMVIIPAAIICGAMGLLW